MIEVQFLTKSCFWLHSDSRAPVRKLDGNRDQNYTSGELEGEMTKKAAFLSCHMLISSSGWCRLIKKLATFFRISKILKFHQIWSKSRFGTSVASRYTWISLTPLDVKTHPGLVLLTSPMTRQLDQMAPDLFWDSWIHLCQNLGFLTSRYIWFLGNFDSLFEIQRNHQF